MGREIRFYCDSGANTSSKRVQILNTVKDLGLEDGQWEEMTRIEQYTIAKDWACGKLIIGYDEVEKPNLRVVSS